MDELTDQDRARVARGWRRSGLTQPAYAASHGITDRTLRLWLRRWAPTSLHGTEAAREICARAIEHLRALLADLDCNLEEGVAPPRQLDLPPPGPMVRQPAEAGLPRGPVGHSVPTPRPRGATERQPLVTSPMHGSLDFSNIL